MTLSTKVQRAVDLAFSKIDSLLVTVVFANKPSTGFNFATGSVITSDSSFTTRGFLESKKKTVDGSVVTKLMLTVKTVGILFSGYTTATIEGVVYNCSVSKSDQFITVLELVGV